MKRPEDIAERIILIVGLVAVVLATMDMARADKLDEYGKLTPFGQCDVRAQMFIDGMIMRNRGASGVKAVINGDLGNEAWTFESPRDAQFYLEQAEPGWEEMDRILLANTARDNESAPAEWKGKINETPYPDSYMLNVVLPRMRDKCRKDYRHGSRI